MKLTPRKPLHPAPDTLQPTPYTLHPGKSRILAMELSRMFPVPFYSIPLDPNSGSLLAVGPLPNEEGTLDSFQDFRKE